MEILLFYVPCSSETEAKDLIKSLLDNKIIACGNVISSQSLYIWEGSIQDNQEWIAIIKTLPSYAEHVQARVESLHTYDIPAILHWQVACNSSYFEWVKSMLNN